MSRLIRSDDLVGRLGGEEFAILLRNTDYKNLRYLTDRLLQPMPYNSGFGQEHLSVRLSIGACQLNRGGDLEAAMMLADKALYEAKRNGRNRLEVAVIESVELDLTA